MIPLPKLKRLGWLSVAGANLIALASVATCASFSIGECSCTSPEEIPDGVDAGPGEAEIGARLDAAIQTEAERIRELERRHAEELEELDAQEQAEYEAAKSRGREALARWFSMRSADLLRDAGR